MIPFVALLLASSIRAAAPSAQASGPTAPATPAPASARAVSGTIRDAAGLVVPEATVIVRTATGGETRTVSGTDGRFAVTAGGGGGVTLIVRADGFAESRQVLADGAPRTDLAIALTPATVAEAVTVTATRSEQRMGDTPASVNVIDRQQIRQSSAVVADDVLRQLPTFSLFRRTSSLSSNPTAQGVSLRGIGPSGVSRTLVLLDGVPFNDPFGGWVYWTRVPLESTDRIEMVDGSSSSLYGNYAMGGVINIVTMPPTPKTLDVQTQYGNLDSPKVDVRASDVWGRLGVVVEGSAFNTDGFPIVAASERGAVDTRSNVDFRNANVRLQYDVSNRVQAFFQSGYFREKRNNGKMSTIDGTPEKNDTRWTTASGGVKATLADSSQIQMTVFGDSDLFHSNFLAVPAATPARSIGRMSLNQTVPTHAIGGTAQWSRAFGARNAVSAGLDWRQVKGDSEEDGLDATFGETVTSHRVSGGRQRSLGFFVQDLVSVTTKLSATVSVRADRWHSDDAHNFEFNEPSGTPTANNAPTLPDRSDTAVSPRLAALYHLTDRVSVWSSIGTGFRAPTLNELYRQFRVGTVLTLPNNQLGPERLVGGEAGVKFEPLRNLSARVTWFDNQITNPVSNVTLTQSGANVTQQRQNLGATEIWGVQNDLEYRIGRAWRVTAGYLYNHATVTSNPSNPALVGNFLPQVPMNRGSMDVSYSNPRLIDFLVEVEAFGSQFDDDQNLRVVPGYTEPGLPKYAVVSFQASRAIGRGLDVFVGAQNLLNQTYYVGTLPTTIGTPRMVNVGVRVHVSGQ